MICSEVFHRTKRQSFLPSHFLKLYSLQWSRCKLSGCPGVMPLTHIQQFCVKNAKGEIRNEVAHSQLWWLLESTKMDRCIVTPFNLGQFCLWSADRIAPYPRFCMLTFKCRRKHANWGGLKLHHIRWCDRILLKTSWNKIALSYSTQSLKWNLSQHWTLLTFISMLEKKHPDGKMTHILSYYCHLISQNWMKAFKVEPLIG